MGFRIIVSQLSKYYEIILQLNPKFKASKKFTLPGLFKKMKKRSILNQSRK
jgi:hypothetical protein